MSIFRFYLKIFLRATQIALAYITFNFEDVVFDYSRLFLARGFVESASPKVCLLEAPNMTAFVLVPAIKVSYVYEFGHLDWPSVGEKQQLKPTNYDAIIFYTSY